MNIDEIDNLKQLISTAVAQEISGVRKDIATMHQGVTTLHKEVASLHAEVQGAEKRLTARIHDLEQSISEVIDNSNEVAGTQLQDHGRRLKLLEQPAA